MVGQMLQNSTTCIFIFNDFYLCSTRYFHIQHFIFIFNNVYFLSTSTKIIFIQQKYLFNFNCHIYLILNKNNCSTSIQTFLFNKNNGLPSTFFYIVHTSKLLKVPGHSKYLIQQNSPPRPPLNTLLWLPSPPITLCHEWRWRRRRNLMQRKNCHWWSENAFEMKLLFNDREIIHRCWWELATL